MPGLLRVVERMIIGDGLQVGGEVRGGRVSGDWFWLEAASDHGLERGGDFRVGMPEPRWAKKAFIGGAEQGLADRRPAAR